MTDALKDGLSTIASFVPKLVLFLLILAVGYFIAKAIGKALSAILERVGFDRAVERGGVRKALQQSRYDASDVVGKIIFYALLLFVLQLAFGVFPANPISDLLQSVINFLPLLIVAIIIIVVAAAIAAAVRELVATTLGGLSYGAAVANGASGLILGIGVIAALNQINVATSVTTPILVFVLATIAGILIIGVGGGLVRPMASRWEKYLSRAEEEAPKVRESAQNAPALREQARQARERYSNQGQGQGQGQPQGQGQGGNEGQGQGEPQRSGAYRAEPGSFPPPQGNYAPSGAGTDYPAQPAGPPSGASGESYDPAYGTSGYPEQQYGQAPYQGQPYGQAPYGGQRNDAISYPAQPYDERPSGGAGYQGDRYAQRGYPGQSYPGQPYAGQYGAQPQYEGQQYENQQYENQQYEGQSPAEAQYQGERHSGETASWSQAPAAESDRGPDDATQQFRLDTDEGGSRAEENGR